MQPGLPATDAYARRLVSWFEKLDKLAPLVRPKKPPDQDHQVHNEQLKAKRAAAHAEATQRWETDYLKPWQQRKDEHDRKARAERDAQRARPSGSKKKSEAQYAADHQRAQASYLSKCRKFQRENLNTGRQLCGWKPQRYYEEKKLLGELFVRSGQRVRIMGVASDDERAHLNGRYGTVVRRAHLCFEDDKGHVVRRPATDGHGQPLFAQPHESHLIRIDGLSGDPIALRPPHVEPWPRDGQRVRGFEAPADQYPNEIATVVAFTDKMRMDAPGCDPCVPGTKGDGTGNFNPTLIHNPSPTANDEYASLYRLSQLMFAQRRHIKPIRPSETWRLAMDDWRLERSTPPYPWLAPGLRVELLPPHPRYTDIRPEEYRYVVKETCPECTCVVLDCTFEADHHGGAKATVNWEGVRCFEVLEDVEEATVKRTPRWDCYCCDHLWPSYHSYDDDSDSCAAGTDMEEWSRRTADSDCDVMEDSDCDVDFDQCDVCDEGVLV